MADEDHEMNETANTSHGNEEEPNHEMQGMIVYLKLSI